MAEKAHRSGRQMAYNAMSNLVLSAKGGHKGMSYEKDEVKSLSRKLTAKELMGQFGDRARGGDIIKERIARSRKKRERSETSDFRDSEKKKKIARESAGASVLTSMVDLTYRPRSKDTTAAYEVLLSLIQEHADYTDSSILRSAADEVITVLRDGNMTAKAKQADLAALFRHKTLSEDRFSKMLNVAKKLDDFEQDSEVAGTSTLTGREDEGSVHVLFEEDAEMRDSDVDEVIDDIDEGDGEDAGMGDRVEFKDNDAMDVGDDDDDQANSFDVRSVDAFWIQRQLGKFYPNDPVTAQTLAEQVYVLLDQSEVGDRDVENKLVLLLDYDKFDFIKILLKNRLAIAWCTKLARASDEDRLILEQEMASDPGTQKILYALQKTETAQDKLRSIKKEARSLMTSQDKRQTGDNADLFWTKKPSVSIDLAALSFAQGGQLMSNAEVKLPPNAEVISKKGYQEVHIPPLRSKMGKDERLKPLSELPEWTHAGFKGMESLNRVQSQIFQAAFETPQNMLICAPTGAGKTNCAMLAIMRELGVHRRSDGSIDTDAFKVVYVAPMKSLVQEMVLNFGARLAPYGVKVRELSGDVQMSREQIADTQVIVTTPEKWDIVTRKSGDRTYTQLVRLIIIDEIHLLHDSRGPVLESIVARTIRQIEYTQELTRLVGLSATLPNYEDVAMFLRVREDTGLFFFDNSFRPVPLQQQYIGVNQKRAFKRHEMMNELTYKKCLQQVQKGFQVLVFVHSRKDTYSTAKQLVDTATDAGDLDSFLKEQGGRKALLTAEAEKASHPGLKELLPYGLAIHHAGMNRDDRTLVEELFDDNHIRVLVCTATLAWGVNLPAHAVIIKGTQVYSPEKGSWTELSIMDVMQMLGRAGRPQHDKFGEGIIITSQKDLQYYLSLLNEQLPVESQYISKLADNLNAEIVLGSVHSVQDAVNWLGYTYLFIRMLRAPHLYGITPAQLDSDPDLEQRRIDLIHAAAVILDKAQLIKYDRKSGKFQSLDLGKVSSHYYIGYESMNTFNEHLKPSMSDIELFRVFSLATEFKYMSVREEEKMELAKLLDKVPIPVKETVDDPTAKVNVLLQTYISRLNFDGFALMADMVYITQSGGRIARALYEIAVKRGWSAVATKCLNLSKMIQKRMWVAQTPLRQFSSIPSAVIKRVEGKALEWERYHDLEYHALGELVRFPKLGRKLYKCIHQLPRLDVQGHVQPVTRTLLRVELTLTPDFQWDEKLHGTSEPFWIFVEDADCETALHVEYFVLRQHFATQESNLSFTVPIYDPLPPQYFVRVLSDRWIGSETVLPISFRTLILPERFPAQTQLLDLQRLHISELASEAYINYFQARGIVKLNSIQTQVFKAVYKHSHSLFVGAPTGSGKTVLAELSIMRMISENPDGRCVYIAPLAALAEERYLDWTVSLGALGINVTILTGETTEDLKRVAAGQVVISVPEHWDVMSRRWKVRKNVQSVSLFIVDEIHMMAGSVGPVIEVVVSRMRYIASQTGKHIRILALSAAIANGVDVAEWIGATPPNTFSFSPRERPLPLETRLHGFDQISFSSRQLAMVKPAYNAITMHASNKPVLVFVPNRKDARNTAMDFMSFAAGDLHANLNAHDDPSRGFLKMEASTLDTHLQHIDNKILRHTLCAGIGFYHEGMTDLERKTVAALFNAEAITVVVVESKLCWGLPMTAHAVVCMGTQTYSGAEHRYVDMPLTTVIQMMGRACRPQKDENSVCFVFTQSTRKAFYKRFLTEAFPIESHLEHSIADHVNAEIITKRIENIQDAVDFLTWTFMYRRLTRNPNYYSLQGVSHQHISDHMSELVENVIEDLSDAKCISVDDETDLAPLNLGMIAAYYYLSYTTVELFAKFLNANITLDGLVELLSNATEFATVNVYPRDEIVLRTIAHHSRLKIKEPRGYADSHVKANLLLQSYFSRVPLSASMSIDQLKLLPHTTRLLQAMVDVISSNGWLLPALACMELSQMVTHGMWHTDNHLLQLPHFSSELAEACKKEGIESVLDISDMEDDQRSRLLSGLSKRQMGDVAAFCNAYPDLEMTVSVPDKDSLETGSPVTVVVSLDRDEDEEIGIPKVVAPRYPEQKSEGWWIVIGNAQTNELLSIKRLAMKKNQMDFKLQFVPSVAGTVQLKCFLICDSYIGVDQEEELQLTIAQGSAMSDESDSSGSED